MQPELITSFTESFKIPTGPRGTPAVAGQVLLRGHDPADNVNDEQQKTFRSGIGKLLHLTAKSRPEIANSVREISKFMDGAVPAHINAMYHIMRYVIATPQRGLEIAPDLSIEGHEITGKSDTDYAKDPTTRRSVTGYSILLNRAYVDWKSKMQQCVTLSSMEAEYVRASQTAQQMLFAQRILESLGLKVKMPMILEVDNTGAIDLANNWSSSTRTKHIDVRHHFLRELVDCGVIKLKFVRSEENVSDIFTKNLAGPLFHKHAKTLCGDDGNEIIENEDEGE